MDLPSIRPPRRHPPRAAALRPFLTGVVLGLILLAVLGVVVD